MLEELKNLGNRLFLSQTQDWNAGDINSTQASKTTLRMKEKENRISTLASKQEKKDQVVQLSENEFSDAAENMCSAYRKLMCTESWI